MDEYFRPLNKYYYTDQINDRHNIYHFSPQRKSLTKVDYLLSDWDIKAGKFVVIRNKNQKLGLADALTSEIVLPMEYGNLNFTDGFWIGSKNQNAGVLDSSFREIIPFQNHWLKLYDDHFFVKKLNNSNEDIYDKKGKNLTKGQYDDFELVYNSGRILAKKYIRDNQNIIRETQYYYLGENGEIVVDLQKKGWEKPEPYSAGLAAVKDKRTQLYGFIDTKGEVVIPFNLLEVFKGFFDESGLAAVRTKDSKYVLIDKQQNVKKVFPGKIRWVDLKPKEVNNIKIDNQFYNSFGEPVTDKNE